jgi:hypothetical protein
MTDEPATRALTYRELAAALGISVRAAEARARRRIRQGHWHSQKGNDGAARLMVPVIELEADRAPTAGTTDPITPGPTVGITVGATHPHAVNNNAVLAELQAVLARLAERDTADLQEARMRADQQAIELADLRERLGRAEAERDEAKRMAEVAEAEQERGAAAMEALRQVRERLSRQEGELDGIRLATEHLHDELARAHRDAAEAQTRAAEVAGRAEVAERTAQEAKREAERLRARGLVARVLNRG